MTMTPEPSQATLTPTQSFELDSPPVPSPRRKRGTSWVGPPVPSHRRKRGTSWVGPPVPFHRRKRGTSWVGPPVTFHRRKGGTSWVGPPVPSPRRINGTSWVGPQTPWVLPYSQIVNEIQCQLILRFGRNLRCVLYQRDFMSDRVIWSSCIVLAKYILYW